MKNISDFNYKLTVRGSARHTQAKIAEISQWWAKKVTGKSEKLNDQFTVHFGETFVDFQISELIEGTKTAWLVTDCNLHWLKDKKEWNKDEIIWNLSEKDGKTSIDFVHKGMTPESECYETCKPGWTHHIKDSLVRLIEEGRGLPE